MTKRRTYTKEFKIEAVGMLSYHLPRIVVHLSASYGKESLSRGAPRHDSSRRSLIGSTQSSLAIGINGKVRAGRCLEGYILCVSMKMRIMVSSSVAYFPMHATILFIYICSSFLSKNPSKTRFFPGQASRMSFFSLGSDRLLSLTVPS